MTVEARVWDEEKRTIALVRPGVELGHGHVVECPLLDPDEARELARTLMAAAVEAEQPDRYDEYGDAQRSTYVLMKGTDASQGDFAEGTEGGATIVLTYDSGVSL